MATDFFPVQENLFYGAFIMKSAKTLLFVLMLIPLHYVSSGCGAIDAGFSDSTRVVDTDTVSACGETYSVEGVLGNTIPDTLKGEFTVSWKRPDTDYPLNRQLWVYRTDELEPEILHPVDLSGYPLYWTDSSLTIGDSLNTLLDARFEILLTEICSTLPVK